MLDPTPSLAHLLDGSLRPSLLLLSDSLVQPANSLLRELVRTRRKTENVCLLCTEISPNRLLRDMGDEGGSNSGRSFSVIDCVNYGVAAGGMPGYASVRVDQAEVDDLDTIEQAVCRSGQASSCTLVVDSLTALETFNDAAKVFGFLKRFLQQDSEGNNRLILVDHSDVPSSPSSSSTLSLVDSLLSPSFASSFAHLILHPAARLAHLHHTFGIDQVGQSQSPDAVVDSRVFDWLPRLRARNWGSPLSVQSSDDGDESVTLVAGTGSGADTTRYDSPLVADVVIDELGHGLRESPAGGRCIVEVVSRGLGAKRAGRHGSDSAKLLHSLEGLRQRGRGSLISIPVWQAVHIRSRSFVAHEPPRTEASTDPASLANFTLHLTDRQRDSRDAVALPYTPRGGGSSGDIIYQPDSGDDMDSDPDEDLEF